VDEEIEKRNLQGIVTCELHEYTAENETFQRTKNNPYPSQGYTRRIRSFQVVIAKENNRNPLDGVFALISSKNSTLSNDEMLLAYRQKYLIENAFREMKSILKLRPWFVYKDDHVRAHYTVCVVAYALERLIDIRLQETGSKDEGWTLGMLKEQLARIRIVGLSLAGQPTYSVLQKVPSELASVIKNIGLQSALKIPKTAQ
jgi:transposase